MLRMLECLYARVDILVNPNTPNIFDYHNKDKISVISLRKICHMIGKKLSKMFLETNIIQNIIPE